MTTRTLLLATAFALSGHSGITSAAGETLDYGFYKARVEPIFLKKRDDHVRFYFCHSESSSNFKLEHLEKGHTTYTEEQSRRIYEMLSKLVVPGEPMKSQLLLQPLAPKHGGNPYHSGGRQFESKNDPDWKTLEAWVKGAKVASK